MEEGLESPDLVVCATRIGMQFVAKSLQWQQMIEEHGAMVYTTSWKILRHRQDVEDIVQDVFAFAFINAEDRYVQNLGGWLRRLATWRSLDRLKSRRNHSILHGELQCNALESSDIVALAELDLELRREIAELPDRQREAFCLRYFDGLSNSAIAEVLGANVSAISTALHKARKTLSNHLSHYFEEERT